LPSRPPHARQLFSKAAVGGEVFSGLIGRCVAITWRLWCDFAPSRCLESKDKVRKVQPLGLSFSPLRRSRSFVRFYVPDSLPSSLPPHSLSFTRPFSRRRNFE